MSIAEFNDRCRKVFNVDERKQIENIAATMFKTSQVRSYQRIGKKEICLERGTARDKTVEVFLMNTTMEMNDELVTRFNKRNKNKAGSNCACS